jgi:alanine dehydrogenase
MIIGVPKEIKNHEYRVALTPAGANQLSLAGHEVHIEQKAGFASGFIDEDYVKAGAKVFQSAKQIYDNAELILKVKEPVPEEYELLREHQTLFTYLHLAANPLLTDVLLSKNVTAIAYETVQTNNNQLPLLVPMSEVAGRMSVQIGATLLQKYSGGMGILLGGVPGVAPAEVFIIGGGVVGLNAAKMAIGLGARVTIFDINKKRLSEIDDIFNGRITTLIFNNYHVTELIPRADLLIGAVLIPGAKAPKLIHEHMVQKMKKGSVIVDVAIDQGGCIETIDRITTHDNPCYLKYDVIHYSVANMPGAVPRTSTMALTGVTLPYVLTLANQGVIPALRNNIDLLRGLNTYHGKITCKALAQSLEFPYHEMTLVLD